MRYAVVIEKAESNYSAYVPDLPGCVATGETVEKTADFAPAFERARASGKPAIVEIRLDPEAITPTRTMTQIRDKA